MSDNGNDDVEAGGDDVGGGDDTRAFEMTEMSHQSYCGKMGESCQGMCFGIVLFVVSIILLIFNEGRAVKRAKDLEEGQEIVVEIDLSAFDKTVTANNNELIHAVGKISTNSILKDDIFGVTTGTEANVTDDIFAVETGAETNGTTEMSNTSINDKTTSDGTGSTTTNDFALRLKRDVQMYQWQERSTKKEIKTSGGGTRTETTYSYDKVWSSTFFDSRKFKNVNSNLRNPTSFPFERKEWVAEEILLGDKLQMSTEVANRFNWYQSIENVNIEDVPNTQLQQRIEKESKSSFYYHANPQSNNISMTTEIGDTIISFEVVEPVLISIVARLLDGKLSAYTTSRGGELLLIQRGDFTSDDLFTQANEENEQLTWILRFVGFIIMVVSILLILQPLATATDIIPFVGDCLGNGMEGCLFPIIAVIISLPISLLVIMLAWLAYRPMIAIPLVVGSGAIVICLCMRARKNQESNEHDNADNDDNKPSYTAGAPSTASVPQTQAQPYYHQSQPATTSTTNDVPFAQALDLPPSSQQQQPVYSTQHQVPVNAPFVPPSQQQHSAPVEQDVVVNAPFVPQIYKP